jgi:hypothetical protein
VFNGLLDWNFNFITLCVRASGPHWKSLLWVGSLMKEH